MRSSFGFTASEKQSIDSFLPEMKKLKRTASLRARTTEKVTGIEMSVAAEVRLKIVRVLLRKFPKHYSDLESQIIIYHITTLDSVGYGFLLHIGCPLTFAQRLKTYFEDKLRGIEAIPHRRKGRKRSSRFGKHITMSGSRAHNQSHRDSDAWGA